MSTQPVSVNGVVLRWTHHNGRSTATVCGTIAGDVRTFEALRKRYRARGYGVALTRKSASVLLGKR